MDSDAIEEFVREVRAYCEFVNRAATLGLAERLAMARTRLVSLYTSALTLPDVPKPGDTDAGPNPQPPQGWCGFEDSEFYWEVFDPYVEDELVRGSLSDDVLDVYYDVQRGLTLWDADHKDSAIFEWRFHLDIHWGDHAVDALRALHRACNPWHVCRTPNRPGDRADAV